jgi:hypothetical protein
MTIAPGEIIEYACAIHVGKAGPFSATIDLYVIDPDLRTLELSVRGVGVATERPADEKPKP